MELQNELRRLPSVGRLLELERAQELIRAHGHELVAECMRQALDEARGAIRAGRPYSGDDDVMGMVTALVQKALEPTLRRVINATGVIVHTNLGRSLLAPAVLDNLATIASRYSNLEFDLEQGRRGSRYSAVEGILCELSGAPAAMVVNNNAAAVLLCLNTLA